MKIKLDHPVLLSISEVAASQKLETYVIGGYVRDHFLKRPSKDIDIVCVGSGIQLAKAVAKRFGIKKVQVFKNFGTAMIRIDELEIEFVGARKESYRKSSRKPIIENGSLEEDQNRRDFTINALAISLNPDNQGEILDPFTGLSDIKAKLLRTPLEPDQTFSDDPLRMLRAIRFATQLNFSIDPVTFESIKRNRQRIEILSAERIAEEINKIILSPKPSIGFLLLDSCGLLELIFPELSNLKGVEVKNGIAHKDNFLHTIKVLDNISPITNNLWLRWATLLHDIAKPKTKRFDINNGWTFHGHNHFGVKMVEEIFSRFKLPLNEKMKYVQKLVNLHMRPIVLAQEIVTDSAIRRLLFEAGDDIDDLMALCEADITSGNQKKVKKYLQNFALVRKKLVEIDEKDRIRNWQPPISGDEIIIAFDIQPSKEVGIIKQAIKEAILEGDIGNDKAEAWDFMLAYGRKLGLNPVSDKMK